MNTRRSVASFVAVWLLVLATQAWGDCAWVLWELSPIVPQKWEPVTSFSNEQACVGVRQIMARDRYVAPFADSPRTYETLRCLPDAIDPRGPKGK